MIWYAAYLAFTLLLAGLAWYPCCGGDGGGDGGECDSCTADSDIISVTLSGWVDGHCDKCPEELDGTHLVYRNLPPSESCEWQNNAPHVYNKWCSSSTSAAFWLKLTILLPSANLGWWLAIGFLHSETDEAIYAWDSGGTDAFDCTAARTLTIVSHSHSGEEQCQNIDGLTVQVN